MSEISVEIEGRGAKQPQPGHWSERETQELIWSRYIRAADAAKLLLRKANRRLHSRRIGLSPVVAYNGLVVYDAPEMPAGGMVHAPRLLRAMVELGIGRCERLLDFCSGAGHIGYFLLAHGFCRTVAMCDIDAEAIRAAQFTAEVNGIADRVTTYVSDGLASIPKSERWDAVVANGPHVVPRKPEDTDIVEFDPGWRLHRSFYSTVGRFMKPGGKTLLIESAADSEASTFEPMVRTGGGTIIGVHRLADYVGRPLPQYVIISQW